MNDPGAWLIGEVLGAVGFVSLGPVDGSIEFGFVHADVGWGADLLGVFWGVVGCWWVGVECEGEDGEEG